MATGLGIPSLAVQSQVVCLFPVRNGDSLHTVTRNSSLENTPRLWLDRVPLASDILLLLHFILVPRRHKLHLFPSPQQCSYIVYNVSPWRGMQVRERRKQGRKTEAGERVQWVRLPVTKPEDFSLIPETWWKEKSDSNKLSSDFPMHCGTNPTTYTIHKIKHGNLN